MEVRGEFYVEHIIGILGLGSFLTDPPWRSPVHENVDTFES